MSVDGDLRSRRGTGRERMTGHTVVPLSSRERGGSGGCFGIGTTGVLYLRVGGLVRVGLGGPVWEGVGEGLCRPSDPSFSL